MAGTLNPEMKVIRQLHGDRRSFPNATDARGDWADCLAAAHAKDVK